MKSVISRFKANVTAVSLRNLNTDENLTYLQENYPLHLQSLNIEFAYCSRMPKDLCKNFFVRNANSLTHISIKSLYFAKGTNLALPPFKCLNSLELNSTHAAIALVKAGAQSLTELKISTPYSNDLSEIHDDDIHLPKLKRLELNNVNGKAPIVIIKACQDTLVQLIMECVSDITAEDIINNIKLKKLERLELSCVDGNIIGALIQSYKCKDTITELKLHKICSCNVNVFSNMLLPNLKILDISNIYGDTYNFGDLTVALIRAGQHSITELKVAYIFQYPTSVIGNLMMSNLKELYLEIEKKDKILALITAGSTTITDIVLYNISDDFNASDMNAIQLINLRKLHLEQTNVNAVIAFTKLIQNTVCDLKISLKPAVIDGILVHNIQRFDSGLVGIQIPHLTRLHVSNMESKAALALIKAGMNTISELEVGCLVNFNIVDVRNVVLPKLKVLKIKGVYAIEMINAYKDTIVDLQLEDIDQLSEDFLKKIELPKLEQLYLSYVSRDNALAFIKIGIQTLSQIMIRRSDVTEQEILELEIPHLDTIEFKNCWQ